MKLKSLILIVLVLLLYVCTSVGCGSNTQPDNNHADNLLSSGSESKENVIQEDVSQTVEYFSEETSLSVPIPSSLYPDFFNEADQELLNNIIMYMYDPSSDDYDSFKEYYTKYLYYLRDDMGFDIVDASDEVYPAAVYLIHNGEFVAMVSPNKKDDDSHLQLSVSFGEGLNQIYERFHGSEKTSNGSNNSKTLTLTQGNYSVPNDIPAGTYDVEINSTDQYAISSLYYSKNEKLKGIYAINHDKGYKGLKLESGDSIEISGDSIILKRSY